MKEVLMTADEVGEEIRCEDICGVNTLLQNLFCFKDKKIEVDVFKLVNEQDINCGWIIRDKKTGEKIQL